MEVSAKLLNPKFKPIEIKIVIENEDEKNEYINYMNGKLTKRPKSVENLFSKIFEELEILTNETW